MKAYIELIYTDESTNGFNIEVAGKKHDVMATITMVTRGTLMASMAERATAYNEEGFYICAYTK